MQKYENFSEKKPFRTKNFKNIYIKNTPPVFVRKIESELYHWKDKCLLFLLPTIRITKNLPYVHEKFEAV